MKYSKNVWMALLVTGSFAAGALAQQGANYFHRNHPNLEIAERDAAQAADHIKAAQAANEFDFGGHAMAARNHLSEANKQLGLAEQYIRQHPEKEKK